MNGAQTSANLSMQNLISSGSAVPGSVITGTGFPGQLSGQRRLRDLVSGCIIRSPMCVLPYVSMLFSSALW